jgi:hypothetical protein
MCVPTPPGPAMCKAPWPSLLSRSSKPPRCSGTSVVCSYYKLNLEAKKLWNQFFTLWVLRVETRRLSSNAGPTAFNLYSPPPRPPHAAGWKDGRKRARSLDDGRASP